MMDKNLQEWEEYDARLIEDSPFTRSTRAETRSEYEFPHASLESAGEFESPFLTREMEGVSTEAEAVPVRQRSGGDCGCGCGKTASSMASNEYDSYMAPLTGSVATGTFPAEAETSYEAETAYGEAEGLEEAEINSEAGSGCGAGCPEPSKADQQRIRRRGSPQGAFIERTEGDKKVNLALQLFDYDVNEYRPLKPQHREALTRIREFVVQRTAETGQRIAVTITGLASRTGSKGYNDALSCKRAECVADNLRQAFSFFRGVPARVQMNALGEGFARATCKGSDCELGEWRSVLIQVHAPGNTPRPIPPVDPGWDKYEIRCLCYRTESLPAALLGDLLKKGLPGLPPNLRSGILKALKKGFDRLTRELLKQLPKLSAVVHDLSAFLELFPAEIIRESGMFEIRERDKQNARSSVLCYSGLGLRIVFPRANIDDFLDETIGKVGIFKTLPDAVKKQIREAIKKMIPGGLKTLVQPIGSETPGPFARFNLKKPRNIGVFTGKSQGDVQIGKGIWMPGQVNVEFNSAPWTRPDPIQRPHITNCPDTDCNDAGVQAVVGNRQGLELFSITAGTLAAGACVCKSPVKSEMEGEAEGEYLSETENSESSEGETQEGAWSSESYAVDPYASIRSAMSPEYANLSANEITPALGRMPASLVLHQMLNSPQMKQATLASILGNSGQRSVQLDGSVISVPAYLRLVSQLCREVAERTEAEELKRPDPALQNV